MPIKPNLAHASFPALTGFSLLAVDGVDAEAFLQAQTMNDVRALSPMQWQWNGWLTAKGRVQALFALVRLAPERFWLVLPDFPAAELLPLLQRYVFRSKVKLSVVDGWRAAADGDGGQSGVPAAPERVEGSEQQGYLLDFTADGGARRLLLLPVMHPALAEPSAINDRQWRDADIAHGLPRIGDDQRQAWTPQMLSLERLNAFSLRKGCYPGQEIVARTHYLGQAKRILVRLSGVQLQAGQEVSGPTLKLGTVVCASNGIHALAVMSVAADMDSPLNTDAGPCQQVPLLAGLARN